MSVTLVERPQTAPNYGVEPNRRVTIALVNETAKRTGRIATAKAIQEHNELMGSVVVLGVPYPVGNHWLSIMLGKDTLGRDFYSQILPYSFGDTQGFRKTEIASKFIVPMGSFVNLVLNEHSSQKVAVIVPSSSLTMQVLRHSGLSRCDQDKMLDSRDIVPNWHETDPGQIDTWSGDVVDSRLVFDDFRAVRPPLDEDEQPHFFVGSPRPGFALQLN